MLLVSKWTILGDFIGEFQSDIQTRIWLHFCFILSEIIGSLWFRLYILDWKFLESNWSREKKNQNIAGYSEKLFFRSRVYFCIHRTAHRSFWRRRKISAKFFDPLSPIEFENSKYTAEEKRDKTEKNISTRWAQVSTCFFASFSRGESER